MKTAVSIPDSVFASAEKLAKRLGVSRSQLYAQALARFLAQLDDGQVTAQLNAVYAKQPSRLDPVLRKAQLKRLARECW